MQMPSLPKNTAHLYRALKKEIQSHGLLKETKTHYVFITILTLILSVASFALAVWSYNVWGFIAGTVMFAFFAVQFGFIGHDAAHQAISSNKVTSAIFGQLGMSFILGLSYHAWWKRHSDHHVNPNDEEEDPDLRIAFSYSEEHAKQRKGIMGLTTKY